MRFGRAAAAVCGAAAVLALAAGASAEPAESREWSGYCIIAHDRDISIVSAEPGDSAEELLGGSGYDPDDYILEVTDYGDYRAIELFDPINFMVVCDGETTELRTVSGTVGGELDKLGITLGEEDILSRDPSEPVTEGMTITVLRVTYGEDTAEEPIPFDTVYRDTDTLDKGATKVETEGADGVKRITYRVKYIDGQETGREATGDEVVTEPVDQVILRGTKEPKKTTTKTTTKTTNDTKTDSSGTKTDTAGKADDKTTDKPAGSGTVSTEGNTVTANSGETYAYSKVLDMKATAYTYTAGSITASGKPVQVGIVAMKSGKLPMGTRVYIVSNDGNYTYGPAVVGDICGSDIVDLFYETVEECKQFGVRQVKVYVLE